MGYFDVHAHLTSPRFSGQVDTIIERASRAGVTTIVSNGLYVNDNERVLALAREHTIVKPAIGYYPVDAVLAEMTQAGIDYPREDVDHFTAEETVHWIGEHAERAFAIGEIGLDHHWVPAEFWERQERIFLALVDVARAAHKPIIIHTRKAERRAYELLSAMPDVRVNWHCYSSRLKLGKDIAETGHYLSIPANAPRSETFAGLLRSARRTQLLLETDCPYLAPEPGGQSEPSHVTGTVRFAAELWGTTESAALSQFEENFERLFGCAP